MRSLPDIPLLMHHDSRLVVGRAKLGPASSRGVPFEARLPKINEAGVLRDRVEEAWQSVKYRLITGVSIGFKPDREKIETLRGGGLRYGGCEVCELSIVPVPAQAEATIEAVKALGHTRRRSGVIYLDKSTAPKRGVIYLDAPIQASSAHRLQGEARPGVIYLNPPRRS